MEDVAEKLDFRSIIPPASSKEEFIAEVEELLSGYGEFIAFKVKKE